MALIILGLDGMNENLLELCQKDMPFLLSLREKTPHSSLKGVNPYLSSTSWISILTGKSIGEHGIVSSFYYNKENEIKLIRSEEVKEEFFYETISRNNLKTFLMDVPYSRSNKLKGDILKNIFEVNSKNEPCKPKSLEKKFPSIKEYINTKWKANTLLGALKHMDNIVEKNKKIITEVINHNKKTKEYALLFFQFPVIDWIQHKTLIELEEKKETSKTQIAKKTLRKIDNVIKEITEKMEDDDEFLIFSDHGSSILKGVLHINSFLKEKGYIKKKEKEEKIKSFLEAIRTKIKENGKLHNFSKKWYRVIRKYLPYDPVNNKKIRFNEQTTIAISELKHVPIIKILKKENLEYFREKIKKEIEEELNLKCFNTEIYYNIKSSEKIDQFHKKFGHIIIDIKDKYDFDTAITKKPLIIKKAQFHDSKAFFLAYNKKNKNKKLINGHICDICPTILDYFSIKHNLKGKNLNVFRERYKNKKEKFLDEMNF